MHQNKKAFTLVELIVVITILAILGTIAFISLQGYSKKARDSKRIADISNIKTSLELFSLNTGYYPLPDNGEEVLYDNDLLWTQGVVGTNVTTNLSRNLLKKPTDPLHDIEYIYSLTSSKKEYEVMSVYEGDLATNNLMNSTYASDKYRVKVEGNYNELFIKTSKHIFPVPSIITSATIPLDFDLVPSAIESQVITGGTNFPGLNIPNTETSTGGLKMTLSVFTGSIDKDSEDDVKKAVVEKIQLAYSGSDIETTGVYKTLLTKTEDAELLAFVDDVVLNNSSSSVEKDTEAPIGGDFSIDTTTTSVDITLTITCPEEDGVEMYIDGDLAGIPEWENCSSSKNVELTSDDGSKSVNIKWRDSERNETIKTIKNIILSSCPSGVICGDNFFEFKNSGNYNFIVPAGNITITAVGGGGGSTGGNGCGYGRGGNGGSGGGFAKATYNVSIGTSLPVTVGNGGQPLGQYNGSTDGGTTSVGTLIYAYGGKGYNYTGNSCYNGVGVNGGTGNITSGASGIIGTGGSGGGNNGWSGGGASGGVNGQSGSGQGSYQAGASGGFGYGAGGGGGAPGGGYCSGAGGGGGGWISSSIRSHSNVCPWSNGCGGAGGYLKITW